MASKPFQEKQIEKEKELAAAEKFEQKDITDKPLKHEKPETDHKHQKDTKDNKDHKEQKDHKEVKEHKEQKDHKDKHEKEQHKDVKEVKEKEFREVNEQFQMAQAPMAPQAQMATLGQASIQKLAEHKVLEKFKAEKEFKFEKHEIKEFKIEKIEHEKYIFEGGGKGIYEVPVNIGQGGDPLSQRVANLEAAMSQLMHFIPENLRPDLSQGALKQEADLQKQEAKPAAGTEAASKEEKKR